MNKTFQNKLSKKTLRDTADMIVNNEIEFPKYNKYAYFLERRILEYILERRYVIKEKNL